MSYPYDTNPWDDNYNSQPSGQQQQQPPTNIGGGYGGYSNPMDQFADPVQQQPGDQYYQDQPAGYNYHEGQGQQEQQQQQQQLGDQEQKPSALGRFLRQHLPLYGSVMDTISGINLPFLDALFQHVNRDLLVSKIFYFFFYSAFGSLFPLMGVYFKQQGMNPAQVGILTGVRPFIEIFSAPFWHSLAERFHKSKELLLFSLLSWIVFTYSLAHIRPPASECIAYNDSHYILYTPYSANDLGNFDNAGGEGEQPSETTGDERRENEMFMSKMPAQVDEIAKVKDDILVGEQNRRRRRRRKRQVEAGGRDRFVYNMEVSDEGYASSDHVDLDLDLENDFDDRPISQKSQPAAPALNSPFFEMNGADSDAPEYDEVEQMYSKGSRFKRHLKSQKGLHGDDDVLGESDDPDQEEPVASSGRSVVEGEEEEEEKVNGSGRPRGREQQAVEGEESTEEVDNNRQEEAAAAGEGGDANYKRGRGTAKHNQQPQSGTGSAPAAGITMAPNESEMNGQGGGVGGGGGEKTGIGGVNKTAKRIYRQRHKTPPTHIVGMSPITVEYAVNYKKEKHGTQYVTPMFSTVVYKLDDVKEVFFLLLLLISLGEFFSAPALTLADSATLSYLKENTDLYGRQRMFGSFSWAITLLLVGMALDNATSIADHPCGPHIRERSYTVCFVIFSLLMACAFMTATQFKFNYPKAGNGGSGGSGGSQTLITSTTADSNTVVTTTTAQDDPYASTQPRSIFNTAPPVNAPPPGAQQGGGGKEKFEFLDKWKSAVFAQRTKELPEWVNVFRQFRSTLHLTYLFITWFLGCGVGLVFTFLFWHLQDVGGTPTLFGICSVINHISEILAYFFSFSFIKRFGHTKVLSVGLGCNVVRFIYVAFLTNPYYALPFELVQGITHAACFAACCSYISHKSKPELRTSTQGVMQGLHHGIGRACGALLGGYMINAIGSRASFCIYGLLSGCVLAGFLYVRKKASQMESEEEEMKVDDSEALGGYGAPQGVPSAIPGKIGVGQPSATAVTSSSAASADIDYQW